MSEHSISEQKRAQFVEAYFSYFVTYLHTDFLMNITLGIAILDKWCSETNILGLIKNSDTFSKFRSI